MSGGGAVAARCDRMRVSGRIAIVLLSALLTLTALDRAVAFFDLAYSPTRGRQNDVRRIERAEFAVDVRLNALGLPRAPAPVAQAARRAAGGRARRFLHAGIRGRGGRSVASAPRDACSTRATPAGTRW